MTLAERASEDSSLRDLMKKVAVGDAKADELRIFQQVIDEITQEHKRSISGQQGPPADRLFVDGRSVQYFAEEVRHILDIVLRANPRQRSADLRPPPGSDRLIVLLVMKALDDTKTRDQIRRIADNRAVYQDTNELKATLEALKEKVVKENSRQSSAAPLASPLDARAGTAANGTPSTPTQPGIPPQSPVQSQTPSAALRSKGPPPNPKLDISAIVFEFAAGNGDRYLFPKFSILEYLPSPGTTTGQQGQQQQQQQQLQTVLASFLIVRRGSSNENGVADPALDYYQPVTIRISAPYGNSGAGGSHGRLLDNLAKVVARPGEVRAYMEDIMDTMTRAEYVLLAMRLPRNEAAAAAAAAATDSEGHENSSSTNEAAAANNGASRQGHRRGGLLQAPSMMQPGGRGPSPGLGGGSGSSGGLQQPPAMGGVLWTMKPAPPTAASTQQSGMRAPDEDERYQAMIASVNRGPPEVV